MSSPEQTSDRRPGSPELPGEPVYLAVGKLRRPHGVRGEILMDVLTDFPERLQPGLQVYVGESRQLLRLRGCRKHSGGLLVFFDEYTSPEAVGTLNNQFLYVRTDEIPDLPEGEYYHHQVLGMSVVSDNDIPLGKVVEILETGASDICVVRPDRGADILIPFVDAFVLKIDLESHEMRVRLLDGLLPSEAG